jgi:alkylation response protein AidB-like acyl-CoA dehydrogenase
MDFELDADQRDLQETARAIVAKECSPAFVRSIVDDGVDSSPWWTTLVSLDWPALAIDEAAGGLGMSWIELAIVLEELGHAIDPSPFLATTTQFVPAVRHCGNAEQARHWLGAVAAGQLSGTLAVDGMHDGQSAGVAPAIRATTTAGGWQLDGRARYVIDGDRADEIALAARSDDGVAVFVVPRHPVRGALATTRQPAFDHTVHVADLELDAVVVDDDRRLSGADAGAGLVRAVEEATLGVAVTTVGACQRILDLTLDHVKQRHQFGRPIGSFQAVKHKAADMYVAIERARALALFAALTIAESDDRRPLAVSMAKAAAGDAQRIVFQHGLQLFGGMGFTWENDLQFALRRAKFGALVFGRASDHRRRVAREVIAG